MIPIRAKVSPRLAAFVRVIAVDLPETYDLALHGSWASGEYHVIEKNGRIHSYSDVDFICGNPLKPRERIAINSMLYKAAASCGLELQGLSIRPADEMRNMWALPSDGQGYVKSRKIQSEFIQFWTYIGAAEVCAAWLFDQDSTPHKRHYYLNKFFLGIWRDLGIISGHHLGSYLETLHFAARRLSSDVCSASYALKLGIETTVPWKVLQSAHQSAILNELSPLVQSTGEFEWIRSVVNNLTLLDNDMAGLQAAKMIECAKDLEGDLSVRKAARARLLEKLKRRGR
jgi:hypothetical protein